MENLIKRFIVWYLCNRCNAYFEYNDKVVRIFSKEFYETEVKEHLNAIYRNRYFEYLKRNEDEK